jgi:hypothetical protein
MEAVWKAEYSLKEIVDRKNYKTYDELKRRLDEVNGDDEAPVARKAPVVEEDEVPWSEPKAKKSEPSFEPPKFGGTTDDDEDEDFAKFRKLIEED